MKVLGIVCSPRKGGNTEILMEVALAGARSSGAETELWTVSGKDIKPCDGCLACTKTGNCHIKDDMQELYPKVIEAQGLIFGSPVYLHSVTSQAKLIIDRLYSLRSAYRLVDKVAGVLSTANSVGFQGVWYEFYHLILDTHMHPADFAYAFASREKGIVRKDDYGMKFAELVGKQVVAIINQGWKTPPEFRKYLYHIVRDDYGISNSPLRFIPKSQ